MSSVFNSSIHDLTASDFTGRWEDIQAYTSVINTIESNTASGTIHFQWVNMDDDSVPSDDELPLCEDSYTFGSGLSDATALTKQFDTRARWFRLKIKGEGEVKFATTYKKSATEIKLTSDDPRFKKFSMMIKLHLPKHAVAQKMRADGFDPVVLDDIDVDGAPVGNRKLERSAQEERPPKDISSVHIPPTSPTGALPAPVEQLASDISTIRPPKVKATSFRLGDRKRPGSSGFSTSPRASPVRGREFGRAQGPGLSGPQTRPPGDKKDFLKRKKI